MAPGLLLASWGIPGSVRAQEPFVVVPEEVTSYTRWGKRLHYHDAADCIPAGSEFGPLNTDKSESVLRVYTDTGNKRAIFDRNAARPPGACNPYEIRSNIVTDASHVWWVSQDGLVRHPADGLAEGTPEVIAPGIQGNLTDRRVELAAAGDFIFARTYDGADSEIWQIEPGNPFHVLLYSVPGTRIERLSSDGKHLYWLEGMILYKRSLIGPDALTPIGVAVTGYHAEGERVQILIGPDITTEIVWIGRGRDIYKYDSVTGGLETRPVYRSEAPDAEVYSLTSLGGTGIFGLPEGVFFLERRPMSSPPPPTRPHYSQHLVRVPRDGGAAAVLYSRDGSAPGATDADRISTDGEFLYWQDARRVLRLPVDAAPDPASNLRAWELEVTQGIQDVENTARLVEGKRTFVRLYAYSNGDMVPGVTADLRAVWTGGGGGPLFPVNRTGTRITVQPLFFRENLDTSFLFEIPLEWTLEENVRFTGTVNPFRSPIEPTYADNSAESGVLEFSPSPRLEVQFVGFGYPLNGTDYFPEYRTDVLGTYSYIRRTYPLATFPGGGDDPGPGFRPRYFTVYDTALERLIDNESCGNNLCAAAYAMSRLSAFRAAQGRPIIYYGMIRFAGDGRYFPRGFTPGGPETNLGAGPVGPLLAAWDTDQTFGDWYTAHEIGHSHGRHHPGTTGPNCDHNLADGAYPYPEAKIGLPDVTSFYGFDWGDPSYGAVRRVYGPALGTDFMSYCPYQWISDYTYEALYNFMFAAGWVPAGGAGIQLGGAGAGGGGDWLCAFGSIDGPLESAVFHHLRRVPEVSLLPDFEGEDFILELRDVNPVTIAQHPFAAGINLDDPDGSRQFGVIVPFAPGTREVRIRKADGSEVLATRTVSSSPPVVTNVVVSGGPEPFEGEALITWEASDPDGDALSFDVLYSVDGGASFRPVFFNLDGAREVGFATDAYGGGVARVRVVATDGVHSAQADSLSFEIAVKPPVARITSPMDGASIEYGQLVHFIGEADDLQDGLVDSAELYWRIPGRDAVQPGGMVAVEDLPVGSNTVTLMAANSDGLEASAVVTVFVEDRREPGPTLSVSPPAVSFGVVAAGDGPRNNTLYIVNAGPGALEWSASEDAPWLSLSATGGMAPAFLTLTANPAGVPEGTLVSTDVVLTSPDDPSQEARVHVSLAVGEIPLVPGGPGGPEFVRGDCDGNGFVGGQVNDPVYYLNWAFVGGPPPPCRAACDADGDGFVGGNVNDAVYYLSWAFLGGPPPEPPFPSCALSARPADVVLGCAARPPSCP
jgi:hypothetical protein